MVKDTHTVVTRDEKINKDFEHVKTDNVDLKEKLRELQLINTRMSNIIEICEINSHQNEKWIIGLNKLYANFEKMIQFERDNLKEVESSCKQVSELQKEFSQECRLLDYRKQEYASYIDSTLENQKYISSQIKNTDLFIQSRLMLEQMKHEKLARESMLKTVTERKRIDQKKRQKELEEEAQSLQEQFKKCEEIFLAGGSSPENFENSPQFKELMGNLDTKKNLDQAIYENELNIKDLKKKISNLKEDKDVFCELM